MSKFGSVIPLSEQYRDDVSDAAIAEVVAQIFGETSFDRIAKAQASMPQVARRIMELESLVWALAEQVVLDHPHSPLIEQARFALKNRIEIDDAGQNWDDTPPLEPET